MNLSITLYLALTSLHIRIENFAEVPPSFQAQQFDCSVVVLVYLVSFSDDPLAEEYNLFRFFAAFFVLGCTTLQFVPFPSRIDLQSGDMCIPSPSLLLRSAAILVHVCIVWTRNDPPLVVLISSILQQEGVLFHCLFSFKQSSPVLQQEVSFFIVRYAENSAESQKSTSFANAVSRLRAGIGRRTESEWPCGRS